MTGDDDNQRAGLEEIVVYCLENLVCFQVTCREEENLVRQVADRLGFRPRRVHELDKGRTAFFIGPFGTIIFGRIIEKSGPMAVWKGLDNNKTSRHCTITSAVYRRIPADCHQAYMVWARDHEPGKPRPAGGG